MKKKFTMKVIFVFVLLNMVATVSFCGDKKFVKIREFNAVPVHLLIRGIMYEIELYR